MRKNIKYTYLILCSSMLYMTLSCSPKTRTSTTNANPLLSKAKMAVKEKSYDKALKIYSKILKKDNNNVAALLGKSGVYFSLKDWNQSKSLLQKAIQTKPNHNAEMYYSLGLINEKMELFQQASSNYEAYLQHAPKNNKKISKAKFKIIQCKFIDNALKNPIDYNPQLLGPNINTGESEYWAVMNADNHSFVFTRRNNHQEDLYISEYKGDGFTKALAMPFNTPRNEAAHCISPDGNLIIFTRCDAKDSKGGCDLYYTQYKSDHWSSPKNMGFPINSKYWDSQPSLSNDGKTLYFSSKRSGSKGASDIFVSHLTKRKWSTPVSLSTNINTDKSDESPYLHPDGQTLYFRSNGHVGMGDFDIFYAKKDPHTQEWGKAKNIGFPVNTTGSDGALTVAYDGKTAYYATDYYSKKNKGTPNLDIVSFELPLAARSTPVSYAKLHIIDAISSRSISTKVSFYDISNEKLLYEAKSDANGNLLVSLVTGKNYMVNINEKKYSFYSNHIQLSQKNNSEIVAAIIEISLHPIKKIIVADKKEIILNNVFFASGSAVLLPSSKIEIQRLNNYLVQSPTMTITILGHTDNVGANADNLILSKARAKAVYDALITLGISKHRITFDGRGESSPITSNETAIGRSKNRRTSFIITHK